VNSQILGIPWGVIWLLTPSPLVLIKKVPPILGMLQISSIRKNEN
jgi:hypothetical protein